MPGSETLTAFFFPRKTHDQPSVIKDNNRTNKFSLYRERNAIMVKVLLPGTPGNPITSDSLLRNKANNSEDSIYW